MILAQVDFKAGELSMPPYNHTFEESIMVIWAIYYIYNVKV